MLLYNDESLHFNRTYLPSSVGTSGKRSTLRLMPTPRAHQDEEFRNEIHDQNYVLRRGDYSIRLADSPRRHGEVSALVNRMYSWRGYGIDSTAVSSHNQTTLEAFSGQELVGTVTLGLDSQEGLLADKLYKQEISNFRAKNRKICELSKLAIDPQCSSKELLASLFNLAYIHGRIIHKATDFVIEINPRHAGYYKRLLGFRQAGEMRTCQRVNAPAVLMHLELDYVDAQVSSLAGSREAKERSLYTYFLTKHEEERVANNLRRHINRATTIDLTTLCDSSEKHEKLFNKLLRPKFAQHPYMPLDKILIPE